VRIYQNSVQVVGLGSAGTNIVEAFMQSQKTMELLGNDITRISLLAVDIADPEIRSLQESYEAQLKKMVKIGIPKERLRLVAQSVKFPTAEAMFDFINLKYNEYIIGEGAKIEHFVPWLNSTMAIPPMAGGAGRRRALAKAIYALNYYQLGIMKSSINVFKEQALSSIMTPTIVLVYGLGGGTGSGLFFDFARHLRKVLGSGVPIIAFVITPCGGDDPPAKGCSAFTAMSEQALILNKDYNSYVCEKYGDFYRNPLNALIYLPLLPAFSKVGDITTARHELDDAVVDMLYVLMDFDLADLMGGIGTEVGLTNNYAHTIGLYKVIYPVNNYIEAFKMNFESLMLMHDHRLEKLDVMDEIFNILQVNYSLIRQLYQNYLIQTGTFAEEQFEDKLRSLVFSNPRLEDDLELHVKGIEIQAKSWMSDLSRYLSTIKMMGKTGPVEEAIIDLTLHKEGSRKVDNLESLVTNLTKTYLEFSDKKADITDRLRQLIPSSQVFTLRQKIILEDFINIVELSEKSLNILKFYDETRFLAESLERFYEVLPEAEFQLNEIRDIKAELATIYLLIQLMLRTPQDEVKMIDEHLAYVSGIISKRMERRSDQESEVIRVQEGMKRKDFDRAKFEREQRKTFGNKRYAREQMMQIDRSMKRMAEEEAIVLEDLQKVDDTLMFYDMLSKRFELVADYRKRLTKIVEINKDFDAKMAEILQPKKYYEKTSELTETEQMRIIFKILKEQEETLTKENIFREIIDMEHYKDYIKSVVRVFKTPSVMGFKTQYKTDYIWVTITAPPRMWTDDMSQEVYASLAGYVTSEVSRTITVRVVDSRDDWTTRILVVAARGKPEDLESYDEMQLLYQKSSDFERHLSRSYLLEHGVGAVQVIKEINGENGNNQKKK
jgi:hypothetical protein